jgi:hypothetical protein
MVLSRKIHLFIAVCFGISVRRAEAQDIRLTSSPPVERLPQEFHRIDARKLAELLRAGLLSEVYHGETGLRMLKEPAAAI